MDKIKFFLAGYFWFAVAATPIVTIWSIFGGISSDAYTNVGIAALALLLVLPCVAVSLLLTNLALLYYWRPNYFWRVMLILQLIGYAVVAYSIIPYLDHLQM